MAENGFQTTFMVRRIIFNNKNRQGSFSFAPEISVGFNKVDDRTWETIVNVKISDKPDQQFPFDLDVVVSLITNLPNELPKEFALKDYLKVNSLQILYPYVRSIVTNITTAALITPLFLPVADIAKLAENVQIPGIE